VSLVSGCGCIIHYKQDSETQGVFGVKGETNEKFEIISQSSRENWLHPTVAVRRSDSYFDCDISAAWLHVIGSKSLKDDLPGTGMQGRLYGKDGRTSMRFTVLEWLVKLCSHVSRFGNVALPPATSNCKANFWSKCPNRRSPLQVDFD
jgi:hypothetical protein